MSNKKMPHKSSNENGNHPKGDSLDVGINKIFKEEDNNKKRAAALEYTGVGAPRVVAKGEGFVAAQIESVAKQNDVPLLQDALLADVLVNVPLGDEIPENFYFAVAEILAHIYRVSDSIDAYE